MKLNTISSIILLIILATLKISAQEAKTEKLLFPNTFTDAQKELITSHVKEFPENTQVSIAVIDNDVTEYLGIKNNNWNLENIDNKDSIFEIGSITKVMTATILADAVIKGDVTLNTQISELLGYNLLNDNQITLQQLSNHTSGLEHMPANILFAQMKEPANPYKHYDETMLKACLTKYSTAELDQTRSIYSNLGVATLAYGLTKKYGKSYQELLQDIVFGPFDMKSSTTEIEKVKEGLLDGLNEKGEVTTHWEFDVLAGAGAVLSNITDMEKFARVILSGKNDAIELTKKPTFTVHESMDMGLGWHIFSAKNGRKLYWHNGGTGGFGSSMIIDPTNAKAFIILANLSVNHAQGGNIDQLLFEFIKTM